MKGKHSYSLPKPYQSRTKGVSKAYQRRYKGGIKAVLVRYGLLPIVYCYFLLGLVRSLKGG